MYIFFLLNVYRMTPYVQSLFNDHLSDGIGTALVEIFLSLVGRDYSTRDPAIESHREHCYFFGDKISCTVTLAQLTNL
jgi:hypothetical protein